MKNFFQNTETISKIINFFRGEKRFPKVETISRTRNEFYKSLSDGRGQPPCVGLAHGL